HDPTDVLEHPVAIQRSSVRESAGPGDARAGRGDGREANLLEDTGGTGIPGVGEHEARTSVQGKEGGCLVGRRSRRHEAAEWTSAVSTAPSSAIGSSHDTLAGPA